MKVLWFTNVPSLYALKDNKVEVTGGWIPSLEKIFRQENIDLRIAFHDKKVKSIVKENYRSSYYYLIPNFKHNNFIFNFFRKLKKPIENERFLIENYIQVINDFNPDIIQIWGTEGGYGLIIPFLKVPHILHIQGNLNVMWYKYNVSFSQFEILKSILIFRPKVLKQFLKNRFDRSLFRKLAEREKLIYSNIQNVFGRTDWDRRVTKALSPNANYYHCDEIMRDEFYNNPWSEPPSRIKFIIVSVFRDDPLKGLETIYDCAHILMQNNFEFEWNVFGVDQECFILSIIKINRKYNPKYLPVNLKGKKNAIELVSGLNLAHLFVHPSRIENGCNSVSEAMLMGMPVLSSSAGGVQTTIKNNETGYLVQDGDPYALSGAIMEIKDNYGQAIEIGKNAKKFASVRHDRERIYKTVIDTYKSIKIKK